LARGTRQSYSYDERRSWAGGEDASTFFAGTGSDVDFGGLFSGNTIDRRGVHCATENKPLRENDEVSAF
jgi:hypothetical protein